MCKSARICNSNPRMSMMFLPFDIVLPSMDLLGRITDSREFCHLSAASGLVYILAIGHPIALGACYVAP